MKTKESTDVFSVDCFSCNNFKLYKLSFFPTEKTKLLLLKGLCDELQLAESFYQSIGIP